MSTSERKFIYEMFRTSLNDARFNLVTAQKHADAKKWRLSTTHCSISARIIRDLRADIGLDEALLTRQCNSLNSGIDDLYKKLWRLSHTLRDHGRQGVETKNLLQALVAWENPRTESQALEA